MAGGFESARATGFASAIAALLIGIGAFSTAITGTLSDRFGRTATITAVMLSSALLSFTFGWLINTNLPLTLAVGIAYGYLVVAESPVFSTGLTELVAPGYLGAAMGLQSLIGYSMGMISPTIFGWALDLAHNWRPVGEIFLLGLGDSVCHGWTGGDCGTDIHVSAKTYAGKREDGRR